MKKTRGFTLVELLVASLLSGAVLTSIYFVFIANSRQYYTQEQVVQMQESMRFALEFLKNDLRNSGQLAIVNGTANFTDPFYCGPRLPNLRAVDLVNNNPGQVPAILQANGNGLGPDQVRILADASGGTLLSAIYDGNVIRLLAATEQSSAEAIRVVGSSGRFTNMYREGLFLRVMDATGKFDLVPITATNFVAGGQSTLSIERAPACVSAGAESLRVNPVQLVRYRIGTEDPLNPNDPKTNLIRELLDVRNPNPVLARGTLTVAEFVVNLQVWGTYDDRLASVPKDPRITEDADPTDDLGNFANAVDEAAALNANPHRIRSLNVLLATRSNREDPDLHLAPDRAKAAAARIAADRTWFDVVAEPNGVVPAYARVTTLTARVETPNLMTEADL